MRSKLGIFLNIFISFMSVIYFVVLIVTNLFSNQLIGCTYSATSSHFDFLKDDSIHSQFNLNCNAFTITESKDSKNEPEVQANGGPAAGDDSSRVAAKPAAATTTPPCSGSLSRPSSAPPGSSGDAAVQPPNDLVVSTPPSAGEWHTQLYKHYSLPPSLPQQHHQQQQQQQQQRSPPQRAAAAAPVPPYWRRGKCMLTARLTLHNT